MTSADPRLPKTHLEALQNLIALESEALQAEDLTQLKHIAVNHPRKLLKIGHIIWVSRRGGSLTLGAMSSQVNLDKTTPFAQWMIQELRRHMGKKTPKEIMRWDFDQLSEETSFTYPFRNALYAPFSPEPRLGGLLFTRDKGFSDSELALLSRLAQIFGSCAMALKYKARPHLNITKRAWVYSAFAMLIAASFIPVPMTSLAPAEIISDNPFHVTAPFDGVIDALLVPPNAYVTTGTPLIKFVNTAYRNDFILAEQDELRAEAALREASLKSFISDPIKPDIATLRAEKALAKSRKDYAQSQLSKTVLKAPQEGLAIYSSPSEWTGRHVMTGEAIIELADPAKIRIRIEAPLNMGESLKKGARIKLFLDSAPLTSLEAKLHSADYYAKALPNGQMAYEAFALLNSDQKTRKNQPRIGTRGVAKVYGRSVPLGYWVLRRPITMLRQTFGI